MFTCTSPYSTDNRASFEDFAQMSKESQEFNQLPSRAECLHDATSCAETSCRTHEYVHCAMVMRELRPKRTTHVYSKAVCNTSTRCHRECGARGSSPRSDLPGILKSCVQILWGPIRAWHAKVLFNEAWYYGWTVVFEHRWGGAIHLYCNTTGTEEDKTRCSS